jgi:3-dehydroquinate dehydratase-2
MTGGRYRVEVMHGVNLDQLGRRNQQLYGTLTLAELELRIEQQALAQDIDTSFFHSNHEGAFVERLHALRDSDTDAVILNPGAWTHYAWAIRDALEISELPAFEIHLSDIEQRESWRHVSVIRDLCFAWIAGRGADGYEIALNAVRTHLDAETAA